MTRDERFMEQALLLAEEAARLGEVPIGCVVTLGDEIVGRGRNGRETGKNALHHAELQAIDEACRTLGGWRLPECRLYVTLEPCPMCAGAIINARIQTVIYGAEDPKAGSVSSMIRLFDLPYNHKPQVISGVLGDRCGEILKNFFRELRRKKHRAQPAKLPSPDPKNIDKPGISGYDI